MSKKFLNPTPVRTSNNYHMNDIQVDEYSYNVNEQFKNVSFEQFDNSNISVTHNTSKIDIPYTMGIEEEVKRNSNVKLKIEWNDSSLNDNLIYFSFDEDNSTLIDDIEIIVKENCNGKLTIVYEMKPCGCIKCEKRKISGIHKGVIRTHLKRNSNLELMIVNILGEGIINQIKMSNVVDENAESKYNVIDFGGDSSLTNYHASLIGDNSKNNVNTIYIGKDNQLLDMNYIVTMHGKNAKVNMDAQGALKDKAVKHYKGTIDFKQGAIKAEGSENEFCMLLSDKAKSLSLPMLLCDEEDVVGNHSTAAGKVQNKELFYLMSRGLTEAESKILLVRAKMNKVIEKITNEKLKNIILAELDFHLS